MENIIFLDIDGVILSGHDLRTNGNRYLCPDKVKMINDLCSLNNAKVVISSSWRIIDNRKPLLECFDLHHDWKTDNIGGVRGKQIERWINDHRVLSYVIFDDDDDFLDTQKGNIVKTNFEDGLTQSHVDEAQKILDNRKRYYVCSHITKDKNPIVHMIKIPTYYESRWYVTIGSLNWFRNGIRKGATKEEKRIYRDRCCWSPDGLYNIRHYFDWEQEQKVYHNLLRDLDQRNYEYIHHESLWDFYDYIGFDRKRRRYGT